MNNSQTILKIVPSLRARKLPDGRIVLTQKFLEGANEFKRFWGGPIEIFMQCSDDQYDNLDEVPLSPGDLPFRISILDLPEIAREIVADRTAVVLLSLDDFRQNGLGAVCRRSGVACAYISEYSLATRKTIIELGTANPLKRVRRKLWAANDERKRRAAVATSDGLQCNGTPTYDNYLKLSPDALLYFDTRVSPDLLAAEDTVRQRWSESLPSGPIRLLYSGRLVPAKGAEQLVDVAKRLRERNVDFHLYICGDGESKARISDRIRHEQLSRHVTLMGVLEFKSELLPFAKSKIDLFVCCHPQGDPSCTYLETMSCGVPIAGYANEAFEGLVRHSGCGWTVPMNRTDVLADKIAEIRSAPESLLSMSLASLTFAREHTFDQTFSRRVSHLWALGERHAKGYAKASGEISFSMNDRRNIIEGNPDLATPASSANRLPAVSVGKEALLDPVNFLVGAERSGTTLLRLLLDHHPEIAWCSEFEYSVDKLTGDAGFPDLDRYTRWLKRDRIFKMHGWQIDRTLSYPALMDSFLRQKRGRKQVIGATVHRNFRKLLRIWPNARFVYMLRDGRDVARSWINMGWSGNMWTAMEGWMTAELQWQQLRAVVPEDRWIEVRHEDLVSEPVQTLTRICHFLGTEFDAAMFDYVRVPGTTYAWPDPELAQQWKSKQSKEEIRQAEARAGALLRARGYELSGLPPLEIIPAMERNLRLQDRMARLKYRVNVFGLPLTVGEAVTRRLRLCPLQYYFQAQINHIINANLKR